MLDRFSLLALFAANQAVQVAHGTLSDVDRERAGVFVGTGMGGTLTMDGGYQTLYGEQSDRIKPFTILMGMHNAAAAGPAGCGRRSTRGRCHQRTWHRHPGQRPH